MSFSDQIFSRLTRTGIASLMLSSVATTGVHAGNANVVDYPDTGVELGQGWNSHAVEKTTATCIVFQQASAGAQKKNMEMRSVTSQYQLDRELGLSASASYKNKVASVSGKASFANSSKIETSGTTVAALARVDNGNISVAPPDASDQAEVASLIARGMSPPDVNAALGDTAQAIGAKMLQVLPDLAGDDIDARHRAFDIDALNAAASDNRMAGAIRLSDEFSELARTDMTRFRKVCGDSYVATISQGGDLAMVFSFKTSSIARQQDIAAQLKGSGWGADAEADMKSKVASASKNTETTMTYNQTGGSGDPLPTDMDSLFEKIKNFPAVIADAPFNYTMQLGSYEDLINWPSEEENPQASYAAIDELLYRASVWKQLDQDLTTMLDATSAPFGMDAYLLGRGVSRASLADHQETARQRYEEVNTRIRECIESGAAEPPCDPKKALSAQGSNIDAVTAAEMEIRASMPLPVEPVANPSQRLAAADNLRDQIYGLWLQRINTARCARDSAAVCLSDNEIRPYREKVKVDANPQFLIMSNKLNRACMKPAAKSSRLNLVEGCSYSDEQMRFRWDAGRKHLVHVATGKCANVRAGSKDERADIILFKCQGGAEKFANDRWTMQNKNQGWISFKNQKSNKCITVTGELRSGRRLTQSDCSQGPGKAIVWRFVMQ